MKRSEVDSIIAAHPSLKPQQIQDVRLVARTLGIETARALAARAAAKNKKKHE